MLYEREKNTIQEKIQLYIVPSAEVPKEGNRLKPKGEKNTTRLH